MMKCLYFDQDITSGAAYLSTYKEWKVNIFEETSQQKRYIRNYVMGMVYQNPYLGLKMDFFKMVKLPERVLFLRLIMKV